MREQDQGLLSHVNQMRVQQCERSRALVVLVPIFISNVWNLASIQIAFNSARIVEIASGCV